MFELRVAPFSYLVTVAGQSLTKYSLNINLSYQKDVILSSNAKTSVLNQALKKGFWDMLPLNLAVIPWGILCGSLAIQRGFSEFEAMLMPALVFAGAVQLVSIELIASNTSVITLLFTVFIISSRHFLYGLALRHKMKQLTTKWRLSLGFLLTDELFALSGHKRSFVGKVRCYYALAAGGSFYVNWLIWNALGVTAGNIFPDLTELGLEFAIAATFIAIVIPAVVNLPTLVSIVVAGVLAVVFELWHWQFGLVAAAVIAMFSGYSCELLLKRLNKGG